MKRIITERQLRNMVMKSITKVLNEGWLDSFTPKEIEYDSNAPIRTVAEQDGWEINTFAPKTTDTHFELCQKTSFAGQAKKNVLSPRELIEDIKLHLGDKGQIVNVRVGTIGDSQYDVAKTLSFDIKYF